LGIGILKVVVSNVLLNGGSVSERGYATFSRSPVTAAVLRQKVYRNMKLRLIT